MTIPRVTPFGPRWIWQANTHHSHWEFFSKFGGKSFPSKHLELAKEEVEEFVRILEAEGIVVRRPELCDFSKEYETPDFRSAGETFLSLYDLWRILSRE